jgi:arabinoxylan arabinofuranohydrolase
MRNNFLFGLFTLALTASLALVIASCPNGETIIEAAPDNGDPIVRITFDLNYPGDQSVSSIRIGRGTAAGSTWPIDPSRFGHTFDGWFAGTEEYTAQTIIKNDVTVAAKWSVSPSGLEAQPSKEELGALFEELPANLSDSWKIWGHHNTLITQGFSADPSVMVYNDRVYVFASNDSLLYNSSGTPIQITYGEGIQGLRILSSGDLVNWTDHGVINIAGPKSTNPLIPASTPIIAPYTYANRSWAPSAAWKMINGKPKFFIYYGGDNGIGVVSADSPTGPWTSPVDSYLIGRDTPTCADVAWLFDPGVLVDDDGQAYLFFGGGPPNNENTGQARRVKLGDDMISLAKYPEQWNAPYLFEDSEIAKINGRYYYSYCTNSAGSKSYGLSGSYQIAYMVSDEPLGTYSNPIGIMAAPAGQLSTPDENNHHCIFQFKGKTYMAYHASLVARAMGLNFHYRSTSIDQISVGADGVISTITMTRKGVDQVGKFSPYIPNEAETIGIQGGVYTRAEEGASNGMVVTSIDTGDWVALYGVDFGSAGAKKFMARVRTPETPDDYVGAIELRLDPAGDGVTTDNVNLDGSNNTARIKDGTVIGRLQIRAKNGEAGQYATVMIDLDETVTGVHDLAFVFYSSLGVRPNTITPDSRHMEGFEFDQWQFFE